ncbi:MAG: response regulator [Mariprofundales bacterium]|nr:response regulator [Mariprofundales bacterium]
MAILIVDDSASMRQAVRIALEGGGYDIVEAADGKQALAKCTQKFQAVVLDKNMPVMDGFTFLKQFKATPQGRFTPVLMLTTESRQEDKMEGKKLGLTGWIVKPVKGNVLLATIKKIAK